MYFELDRLNRSRAVQAASHVARQTLPAATVYDGVYYYHRRARQLRSQMAWAALRAVSRWPRRLFLRLRQAQRQRRACRELRQLDEHLLRDIGLSYDTIVDAVYGLKDVRPRRAGVRPAIAPACRSSAAPVTVGADPAANDGVNKTKAVA